MSHTKGPWKAHKRSTPVGFAEYEIHWSADGECVAEVVHGEDDAHLISAAPDLLEALKACHLQLLQSNNDSEYAQEASNMARAAIAKAEGKEVSPARLWAAFKQSMSIMHKLPVRNTATDS